MKQYAVRSTVLGDLIVFLMPMAYVVKIGFIGQVFGTDVILALILPFLLFSSQKFTYSGEVKRVFFLIFGWFVAQLVTDLLRATPFDDMARGLFKIGTFLCYFFVLYLLTKKRSFRLVIFAVGWCIGILVSYIFNPDALAISIPWKFGFGLAVAWLAVLASTYFYGSKAPFRRLTVPVLVVIGVLLMAKGMRSTGFVLMATGFFIVAQNYYSSKAISMRRFGVLSLVLLGIGLLTLQVHGWASEAGLLGEAALKKYQNFGQGNSSLLLSGRKEIFSSLSAIGDSPIIGHGSWAQDFRYVEALYYELLERGILPGFDPYDPALALNIPTHSYIFGAWVEAGIVGAMFWIWVIVFAYRTLYAQLSFPNPYAPMIVFVIVSLFWDVLFSPLGATKRFLAPFYLCCITYAFRYSQQGIVARRRLKAQRVGG